MIIIYLLLLFNPSTFLKLVSCVHGFLSLIGGIKDKIQKKTRKEKTTMTEKKTTKLNRKHSS